MTRLALLAMLALVVLPGIGRIAQYAGSGAASMDHARVPQLGAVCTTQGLAYRADIAAIEADGFGLKNDGNDRHPLPTHPGNDCDYCAIAAASVVPTFLSLAPPALNGDTTPFSRRSDVAIWHIPRGLGARGPPRSV